NLNSGLYAAYRNMGGDIPVANAFLDDTQIDLNDPNQPVGWGWERALIQNEDRETTTDGVHLNLTLGDAENNIKTGVHFDKADRFIQGSDGSADWENFACRGGFVPDESAENPDEDRPPCRGVAGSAVPNSAVSDYLIPSEAGFISVD